MSITELKVQSVSSILYIQYITWKFTCLHSCWSPSQQVAPSEMWGSLFSPHFPSTFAAGQRTYSGKYCSSPSLYSLHCLRLPLLLYIREVGVGPDSHSGASVAGGPPRWRWSSEGALLSPLCKRTGMTHWLDSASQSWLSAPPHPHWG